MRRSLRDRALLPVLVPVVILAFLGVVAVGFAQILLSVTALAAAGTALVVAASVVVVGSLIAARPAVRASTLASMVGAVAGIAMLAGGVALLLAAKPVEGGEEGPTVTLVMAAEGIAFTTDALSAPAGEAFAIDFDNRDAAVQHNVEIFDNDAFTGEPVFAGEIVTGPAQVTYEVSALAAGTYWFNCVVHPTTMIGTIDVAEGGGAAAQGPTLVSSGLMFDTDVIELSADTATTVTLDNQDAGIPHNISIYGDSSLAEELFKGELFTGPGKIDYSIPALPAGNYYFQCDVHPTMAGEVVVT